MNNKKKISISTGGFKNLTGLQAAKFLSNNQIDCIELSGGRYSKNQLKSLIQLKKKIRLRVHNYFPPPQIPFVLNLASNNKKIY